MADKLKKNYQGGKKITLKIEQVNEDVYYKRLDSQKIVEEKFKKVEMTIDKKLLKRKLFVKGDSKEQEFEYHWLTEEGKIYDGERVSAVMDVNTEKMVPLVSERFMEFVDYTTQDDKDRYLIENEYILYPVYEEKTNLFGLAKTLAKSGKIAKFKFNPDGYMTGLGFLYAVENEGQFSLVVAYARLIKTNYLVYIKEAVGHKEIQGESFELIEEKIDNLTKSGAKKVRGKNVR